LEYDTSNTKLGSPKAFQMSQIWLHDCSNVACVLANFKTGTFAFMKQNILAVD